MTAVDPQLGSSPLSWSDVGMSEVLPTGVITLLLGDVEGSTRLWESEPDEMATAIAALDRTLADLVAACGGVRPVEQGEGDSFVIAFVHPSDAVACALEMQRAPLAPIRIRIGIHAGEVQLRDNANYIGSTINRTARLRDVAHGGQTVMSGVVAALVADGLPDGVWLTDLGMHQLRDLPRPERVTQLCHAVLHNEFPPLRVEASPPSIRLPAQITNFVGRCAEIAEVNTILAANRLVTLTGAGGCGKTRLAAQVALEVADGFADGVCWVELAPITDAAVVPAALARALGLPDQPGRSSTVDVVLRFIGDRAMLIVLDNCEHLLECAASLLVTILAECPVVQVIATSREPIAVPGEQIWRVPSLSLTDEAIELFTDRARLAQPSFHIDAGNRAAVAEICQRLDGMPLAIELAAARIRAMSPEQVLTSLQDRFRILTGGPRTAVRRQQTLRASVDWSHALLTDAERILFRRLGVFHAGFNLAAVEQVCADGILPRYQILDLLTLLVDKSLVVADHAAVGGRYRLLETVRQYTLERLGETPGEADTLRTRHRDYYGAIAAPLDLPCGTSYPELIVQADDDIDNLRAAFSWSLDRGEADHALALASSLQPLWLTRGRVRDGLAWLGVALDAPGGTDPAVRARALADKTVLDAWMGDYYRLEQAEQALELARSVDDAALLARALGAHAFTTCQSPQIALPNIAEAINIARTLGDTWRLSTFLSWQAYGAYVAGDPILALAAADEGRRLAEALGDGFVSRQCRWSAGLAHWLRADLAAANAEFGEVASEAEIARDLLYRVTGLLSLAKSLAHGGDTAAARALAASAIEAASDVSDFQRGACFGAFADAALAGGDVGAAVAACESALQAGVDQGLAVISALPTAQVALASGDLEVARRRCDETVKDALGVHRMVALATRARVAIAQDDLEQADRDAKQALTIASDNAAYLTVPDVLECLAEMSARTGPRDAARMLGAAQAIRTHTGQVRFAIYDADCRATAAMVRNALSINAFESAWAEGSALSTKETIAYALRGRGPRKRPSSGWGALTPTELEVAHLVCEGLGNKEIGARLFISPRTVQTHLTHVYNKLRLTSRAQLAHEAAHRFERHE